VAEAARRASLGVTGYAADAALACATDAVPPRPEPWREALIEVMAARTQASHIRAALTQAIQSSLRAGEATDWCDVMASTQQAINRLDEAACALTRYLR
jgi:hypothetical protein